MAMAAMTMVSVGGFSGVSFLLRTCPQGVASVLCKKTSISGSRGSKLDHLTVLITIQYFVEKHGRELWESLMVSRALEVQWRVGVRQLRCSVEFVDTQAAWILWYVNGC
jgi:hypothetical protein